MEVQGAGVRFAAGLMDRKPIVRKASAVHELTAAGLWPALLDWGVAGALLLLTVAARVPFRSLMLYHWDSALFALAFDRFDVTQHHPQPPGYISYVFLAKLINILAGERNLSLVIESIAFSGLGVAALYLLGRHLFDRRTGLTAALLLFSSVSFWSYGEIAFPYVALAFFSALLALIAASAKLFGQPGIVGDRGRAYLAAAVFTMAGGFRQDLLLFLVPLWILSLWGEPLRRVVLSLVIAALGFVVWFWPTIHLSGGWFQYQQALSAQSAAVAKEYGITGQGLVALVINVRDILRYVFYALYAQVIILPVALIWPLGLGSTWINARRNGSVSDTAGARWTRMLCPGFIESVRWDQRSRGRLALLAVWMGPPLLFYSFVHVGDPGYVFSFMPAVHLLLASGLWSGVAVIQDRRLRLLALGRTGERISSLIRIRPKAFAGVVLALLVAANVWIFLFHPRILTAPGIRQHDQDLRQTIEYVRDNYPAGSAILLASDSYRHMQYYLPEYRSQWVDVHATFDTAIPVGQGISAVILVDPGLAGLVHENEGWNSPPAASGRLYVRPLSAGQTLIFGQGVIVVR